MKLKLRNHTGTAFTISACTNTNKTDPMSLSHKYNSDFEQTPLSYVKQVSNTMTLKDSKQVMELDLQYTSDKCGLYLLPGLILGIPVSNTKGNLFVSLFNQHNLERVYVEKAT